MYLVFCFFFFKQKTAYEMRISDWSSDVCSSDLHAHQIVGDTQCLLAFVGNRQVRHCRGMARERLGAAEADRELRDLERVEEAETLLLEIGRASCRERVCQYV